MFIDWKRANSFLFNRKKFGCLNAILNTDILTERLLKSYINNYFYRYIYVHYLLSNQDDKIPLQNKYINNTFQRVGNHVEQCPEDGELRNPMVSTPNGI